MTTFFEHGFLGTRGSFMLDFVCLAMAVIVPLLGISVYLVKVRRQYAIHKWVQLTLGFVLAVAVVAFEVDLRLVTDWQKLAGPSPFFRAGTWNPVTLSLAVHLCFAVPTPLLWVFVVVRAVRRFSSPPAPGTHSRQHARWGWLATTGTVMTALTGWLFYALAFVVT